MFHTPLVYHEPHFMIGRFIHIRNKSTKTSIQIQLYTIVKKKDKSYIYLKGGVKGEEGNGMAAM